MPYAEPNVSACNSTHENVTVVRVASAVQLDGVTGAEAEALAPAVIAALANATGADESTARGGVETAARREAGRRRYSKRLLVL